MTIKRYWPVLLTLGLLTVAGCGGGSSSSADRNKDVTSDGNAKPSDPKSPIMEPSTAQWKYATLPDPAPSKTPKDRMTEITFDQNSAVLMGEAASVARETAKKLMADSSIRLYLAGFAHKSEKASMGLSRANAVKDFLIKQGVPAARLEAGSFGSQFSTADKTAPTQMKLERRVEMWLLP